MTRLPHLDRAVVPETKIVNYLLSVSHSSGRAKARFLKGFGFRAQDWLMLRKAIIATQGQTISLHHIEHTSEPDTRLTARC
jgi:hypothetical protein